MHNTSHPKRTVGAPQPRTSLLVITIYRRAGLCLGRLLDGDLPQSGFMCPAKRDDRFLQPVRTYLALVEGGACAETVEGTDGD